MTRQMLQVDDQLDHLSFLNLKTTQLNVLYSKDKTLGP